MAPLKKILVVEDDPDVQEVAGLTLTDIGGFEVKVCASAVEALSAVHTFSPDLVLMDVMMPGLDGLEALARLKAHSETASIPVVLMTARSQPQELAHYRRLGCLDVITKPFDPAALPDQLRGIWSRHCG
jgi:CheY-like chemotaxis protein